MLKNFYDYVDHTQRVNIMFAIIAAVMIGVILIIWSLHRRSVRDGDSKFDIVLDSYHRLREELDRWHSMFGPFVGLYESAPETKNACANDKTIAIDLDGVILEYVSPWDGPYHFGKPIPGAVEAMKKLRSAGFRISVYTTRNNSMANHNSGHNSLELTALVQNELEKNGIPYDYISLFKPLARHYIDDRAIRFYSWDQTLDSVGSIEEDIKDEYLDKLMSTLFVKEDCDPETCKDEQCCPKAEEK